MLIVASSIISSVAQADGRFAVRECHVGDDGRAWTIDYLANAGSDIAATLAARASWLQSLPADEVPVSAQMLLRKTIVDRMTDQELAAAMAELEVPANLRLKATWYAAVVIDPSDQMVVGMLVGLFGSGRAAELLQVA